MNISIAGDSALIVYFDANNMIESNMKVAALSEYLLGAGLEGLTDTVPSYHSLLVEFDPLASDFLAISEAIRGFETNSVAPEQSAGKLHTVPVLYGHPAENDLDRIARHSSLSVEDVIRLHQQTQYRVFALGFSPGFAFLGHLPPELSTPRLDTPRQRMPRGAVALAERQTAVYPQPSPGGWNILGVCPVELFNADHRTPGLFRVGDTVRFKSVTEQEFIALGGRLE